MDWYIIFARYKILITLLMIFNCIKGGDSAQNCEFFTTCSECLNSHVDCVWCTKWNPDIKTKCNTFEKLLKSGCDEEFIQRSDIPGVEIKEKNNKDLHDYEVVDDEYNVVQIKPQKMKIKLRPHEPLKFKIQYRPAKHYPLELYLLMDASYSMRDDKSTIVKLADNLTSVLSEMTTNYRLAFGQFADKPAMPWINVQEEDNPCKQDGDVCEPVYDFKHILMFTDNTTEFVDKLNSSHYTANLDNVDGGLDALMQVAVCNRQIGWNNDSKKIVLLATNSLLHMAGDGILGGILKPNDQLCHLDSTGFYTEALTLDYPSVYQIYDVLEKQKINVIFAATEPFKATYDQISALMPNITHTATIKEDSSNILMLLKQGYEKFVKDVQIRDNSSEPIKFTYRSTCGDKHLDKETNTCPLTIARTYEFDVKVEFDNCPQNRSDFKQTIIIDEVNSGSERLVIDLELLCGCSCEEKNATDFDSATCNDHGNLICGICECQKPWLGKSCECDGTDFEKSVNLEKECYEPVSMYMCSERGLCTCGICDCDLGASGKYCECDDCDIIDGVKCSNRGYCNCGQCLCPDGYSGKNCECSTDISGCVATGTQRICSGRGDCVCGQCQCEVDNEGRQYTGIYCEQKYGDECKIHEKYAMCLALNKNDEEKCKGNLRNTTYVKRSVKDVKDNDTKCELWIDGCLYTYFCDDIDIFLMDDPKCLSQAMLSWGMWIGLATFLIGLGLILAIRVYTAIKDKNEYKRFEIELEHIKKRGNDSRNENPLYKSPYTYYSVPDSNFDF